MPVSGSIVKEHGLRFMAERYWEDRVLAPVRLWIGKPRMAACVHRSGRVVSRGHTFDKDGRCVFCDWLRPE